MRDADAVSRAVQAELEAAEALRLHVIRLQHLNRRRLLDECVAASLLAQVPELLAAIREQAGLMFAAARRLGEDLAAANLRLPTQHLGARGVQRHGGGLKNRSTAHQARQRQARLQTCGMQGENP